MIFFYFLLSAIVTLILVYISYILWKTDKSQKLPEKRFLYIPTIISSIILIGFFFTDSQKPIDIRKTEYTAIGIKHYVYWSKDSFATTTSKEVFSGIYKKDDRYLEFEISKPTYYYFKHLWKKREVEVSNDSAHNIFFTEWNKDPKTALVYTKSEVFTNYFKNSMSLYDYHYVDDEMAKELNLFNENRIDFINSKNILEPRQSLIYGISSSDNVGRVISNLSSLDTEFRPILLVWVGETKLDHKELVCHQRSYWSGGKNNEVVFCVGINNLHEMKILWSDSFSWAITHDFENYVKSTALKPGNILSSETYTEAIISGYSKNYWNPRKFETYSVLSYPIMDFTIILVSIMIIVINIILVKGLKNK